MNLMTKLWNKAASLGLAGLVCCVASRTYLFFLQKCFGFQKWHAIAPYRCRPYKKKVCRVISIMEVKGCIEVGCGLGDIGRVLENTYQIRYHGLDLDETVIPAAQFLAGKNSNLTFAVGGLEQVKRLPTEKYDCVLLLNWAHDMDAKVLADLLISNIGENIKYILIDAIRSDIDVEAGFRYRHSAKSLLDNGLPFRLKRTVKNIDEVRDLLVFQR